MLLDGGMMGDGVADLKAIRAAVKGAGYTGSVIPPRNGCVKN
jgi:sugar phosphate isomerase/epimerase